MRAAAPEGAADGFVARLSTQIVRRPGRLVAACFATALGPAVVAHAGSTTVQPVAAVQVAVDPPPVPGDQATWLPIARRAAATCPGLSPAVLLAIGHIESSLGRTPFVSSAGAIGPRQFLPSTWAAYGVDGDGDGRIDVMNTVDAVHGAARLLCANGGAEPGHLASALWNYNHSDDYVAQVISLSRLIPTS